MSKTNILIPMAGLGNRFVEAGYQLPKPLIDVNGVPMIKAVIDSIGIDANYIFIVQDRHRIKYDLLTKLQEYSPGCQIIGIDAYTDGAVRTTLVAKELIDNDEPLIIINSDQIVEWDGNAFNDIVASNNAIALFTDTDRNTKWSFATVVDGKVTELAEKNPISDNASVGIYGWSKGSDYVKYAEQMIAKGLRVNNEFYVAPVYNEAIADGQDVIPFFVEAMYGLGTPEDLENYLA